MQQAIELLKTALVLLTLLHSNANLSPDFQAQANALVNEAITTAEQALASPDATTTVPTNSIPISTQLVVAPVSNFAPASIPSSGSVVQQDCTPSLASYVTQDDGTLAGGFDFTFNASSTYPVGCTPNSQDTYTLQTPSTLYTGSLDDAHSTPIANGFQYYQGWGSAGGAGTYPSGSFTWTVDGTSTTATFQAK